MGGQFHDLGTNTPGQRFLVPCYSLNRRLRMCKSWSKHGLHLSKIECHLICLIVQPLFNSLHFNVLLIYCWLSTVPISLVLHLFHWRFSLNITDSGHYSCFILERSYFQLLPTVLSEVSPGFPKSIQEKYGTVTWNRPHISCLIIFTPIIKFHLCNGTRSTIAQLWVICLDLLNIRNNEFQLLLSLYV